MYGFDFTPSFHRCGRKRRARKSGVAAPAAGANATGSAKIVTGFPPGGTSDTLCRRVAERLRGNYAKATLVENRTAPPARSRSRRSRALRGRRTILQTPASMLMIYPHIYKKLPYDPFVDVVPVSLGATFVFASPPVRRARFGAQCGRFPRLVQGQSETRQLRFSGCRIGAAFSRRAAGEGVRCRGSGMWAIAARSRRSSTWSAAKFRR
jgi:hypothetical protein